MALRCVAILALVSLLNIATAADRPITDDDRSHWSFVPPVPPPVPEARVGSCRSPIDAFVRQALEAEGLEPAAEATRETLIRRVTFDLTGLPPTPEEIDAFIHDPSPLAYERLVDRLLAS